MLLIDKTTNREAIEQHLHADKYSTLELKVVATQSKNNKES